MGFDKKDLLRQAGYSDGDKLIAANIAFGRDNAFSTSSASFNRDTGAGNIAYIDLDTVPADVTLQARATIQTGGTMDTTGEFKIEFIGQEGGGTEATPTFTESNTLSVGGTGAADISLREQCQVRISAKSDGSNTITVFGASAQLEIVL